MTPTETTRSLLDERGIEWIAIAESATEYTMDGVVYRAYETCDGLQVAITTPVTPEQAIAATVGTEDARANDLVDLLNQCLYTFRLFLSRPDLLNEETVQMAHDELVRKMTDLGLQVRRAAKMADPEGHVRGRAYEVLLMVNRCSKMELTDYILKLEESRDGYVEESRKNELLKADNEKLRELVRDMWRDIPKSEACAWDSSANTCTGSDSCIGECSYWYRMVKLGIEVDDE